MSLAREASPRPAQLVWYASVQQVGTISTLSARLWTRDTARALRIAPRVLAVFAGVVPVALAAGGALLSSIMPAISQESVPPEAAARIRWVSSSLLWLIGALVVTVFQLLAPRRTSLSDVLGLLPVSRTITAVAMQIPTLGIALLVVAPLCAPTVTVLVGAADRGYATVVTAALLLVVGLAPLVALLFNLAVPFLLRLRLPPHHALLGGGVVGMVVAVTPPALELGERGLPWLPHRAVAAAAQEGGGLSLALLAAWYIAGIVLFVLLVGRLPSDPQVSPSRLFVRFGLPRRRTVARAWYELVMLARAPQYAAVVLFTALVIVLVLGAWWMTRSPYIALLAPPVFLPFYFACVQSYGHTRATHWLGLHLLADRAAWAGPKALVCLAMAVTLALPGTALAVAVGLIDGQTVPGLFIQGVVAWSAAMLAGLVIPYSTEQPLSVGLSTSFAGVTFFAGLWAIGEFVPDAAAGVGPIGLAVVLTALYLAVARTTWPELQNV